MKNKTDLIIRSILCLLLLATVISSCSNLPQKEKPTGDLIVRPENPVSENGQTDIASEPGEIQGPFSDTWTEPGEGPTVTPIVLGIEKRGEEGSLIIRTPMANVGNTFSFDQPPVTIPTAVPQTNPGSLYDEMQLVRYNPVNGVVLLPGQAIHLDITLNNTGTTTWQTSYKIVDDSSQPMAVLTEYYLPYAVAPGGNVIISVYMTAPAALGSYQESFHIQDAYGVNFGKFDYVLTVGDHSYATEIPTLTATITPTYYSAEGITATPDSLAWMCIDPERSKLQDCYSFCVEYSHREEFRFCFYDGIRYTTPIPEYFGG